MIHKNRIDINTNAILLKCRFILGKTEEIFQFACDPFMTSILYLEVKYTSDQKDYFDVGKPVVMHIR